MFDPARAGKCFGHRISARELVAKAVLGSLRMDTDNLESDKIPLGKVETDRACR